MRFITLIALATAVTIERLNPGHNAMIGKPKVERPKDVYEIDNEKRYGKKKLEERVKYFMKKYGAKHGIKTIDRSLLPRYSPKGLVWRLNLDKARNADRYRFYWRLIDAVAAKLPMVSKGIESTDTPRPKDISKILNKR